MNRRIRVLGKGYTYVRLGANRGFGIQLPRGYRLRVSAHHGIELLQEKTPGRALRIREGLFLRKVR